MLTVSAQLDVKMFCLESRDTMPASNEEILEAEEENVGINPSWGPKEVTKRQRGGYRHHLKKCLRTIDPETGKFFPYMTKTTVEIKADKIVFAIGQAIEWGNLFEGSKVKFTRLQTNLHTKRTIPTYSWAVATYLTGPRFAIDAIAPITRRLRAYIAMYAPTSQ